MNSENKVTEEQEIIEETVEKAEETEEVTEETAEEAVELTKEEKLEKELSEQKDKYLRLMAEYDNFRKRSAKERLELSANA